MNLNETPQSKNPHEDINMYFSPEIAQTFAESEQNDKNFRVARIVDRVLIQESIELTDPLKAAELGGGAHPDRYHDFFAKLLTTPLGHIDWVDVSPYMLDLAKKYLADEKYQEREKVINFVLADMLKYLQDLPNEALDLVIMKYTIDHLAKLETLFQLLSTKLKPNGRLIATIGTLSPELKSYSTNVRFLYNGEQFPDNETRTLKDGDSYTVKFFRVSGDPTGGYLPGAETTKYFFSGEKIRDIATASGFEVFLGDWKEFVKKEKQEGEELQQLILVLKKK